MATLFAMIGLKVLLTAKQIRLDDRVMPVLITFFGIPIAIVLGAKAKLLGLSSRADRREAAFTQFAMSLDTVVSRAMPSDRGRGHHH